MKPIAIFYHCVFYLGSPPSLSGHACRLIDDQIQRCWHTGLLGAAKEIHIGINGGPESVDISNLFLPLAANKVFHGTASKAENLTIVMLEKWLETHPDWHVFYFHAKGASRDTGSEYDEFIGNWRECLSRHCIDNWPTCVNALQNHDIVGAHWMPGAGPLHNQNIFAGNFWWATSNFLRTLPSIYRRDRIKMSGISSAESRHEAEVWIGNGPRLPKTKDFHRAQIPQCRFDPSLFMRRS